MKILGDRNPILLSGTAVAAAAAIRFSLDPLVHSKAPFLVFLCGVVLSALFGGMRSGLAATILSIPVVDYLFINPRRSLIIHNATVDLIDLVVFLAIGVLVSLIIERFRQTRDRLRQARDDLEGSELRLRTLASTVPAMLFTAAPDGRWNYISERLCEYSGMEDWRVRSDWPLLIHPEDRQSAVDQWYRSMQSGVDYEAFYRLRKSDGNFRWFKNRARPVRSPAGEIVQWTGVCSDVHEQKLLTEALALRTAQLITSNEEFQKFAYRVSHDLKEPMRMIGAFTQILVKRNQDGLDAESRTFTGYILDGVSRVESQLHDLLQYASAGSIEVKTELIDFNVILQSAIDNLRSTIIETGATVTCERLPSLVANPDRIRSVFQNLIGNAIKYRAARPPEVHITAHREKEEWIFAVRDNGIGFAMDQVDRIFKAFERLPSESKVQGSGLGLAILKRIVEGAGGRVWAESERGSGSTFFFALPCALEKMGAAQARSQTPGLSSSARA